MNIIVRLGPDCSMRMGGEDYLPVAEVEAKLSKLLSEGLSSIIPQMNEGQYLWLNVSVLDSLDQLPEEMRNEYKV